MDQQAYKDLISGQTQGPVAGLLRILMRILALVYGAVVRWRNGLYSRGILRSQRVDVPVICVGNLTAGGTGKTPLVIWLYRFVRHISSTNCALLSRGYKTDRDRADEPALFADHCPEAELVINPDRVAGARTAIQRHSADVIIMDDGFQHRRLARDLDMITMDATEPFGLGRMLPAGLLREPLCGLRRAQAVVLTRADQVSNQGLKAIEQRILKVNPDLVLARARHAPSAVKLKDRSSVSCASLTGKRVFAFCGIGNPHAFFKTLSQLQAEIVGTQIFNDHHHCTKADIESLSVRATEAHAQYLLTTEKNFADIRALDVSAELPLGYLEIEFQITQGREELCGLIERALAGKIPSLTNRG